MTKNKLLYSTKIQVRSADINYGGHLGNDRFLTYAQEARSRWLASMGWTEKEISKSRAGIIVKEAKIQFLKEAFLGQILLLKLSVREHSRCSMNLVCEILEEESRQPVGKVETLIVFFDYKKRKIVKMPEEIKTQINVEETL